MEHMCADLIEIETRSCRLSLSMVMKSWRGGTFPLGKVLCSKKTTLAVGGAWIYSACVLGVKLSDHGSDSICQ